MADVEADERAETEAAVMAERQAETQASVDERERNQKRRRPWFIAAAVITALALVRWAIDEAEDRRACEAQPGMHYIKGDCVNQARYDYLREYLGGRIGFGASTNDSLAHGQRTSP